MRHQLEVFFLLKSTTTHYQPFVVVFEEILIITFVLLPFSNNTYETIAHLLYLEIQHFNPFNAKQPLLIASIGNLAFSVSCFSEMFCVLQARGLNFVKRDSRHGRAQVCVFLINGKTFFSKQLRKFCTVHVQTHLVYSHLLKISKQFNSPLRQLLYSFLPFP